MSNGFSYNKMFNFRKYMDKFLDVISKRTREDYLTNFVSLLQPLFPICSFSCEIIDKFEDFCMIRNDFVDLFLPKKFEKLLENQPLFISNNKIDLMGNVAYKTYLYALFECFYSTIMRDKVAKFYRTYEGKRKGWKI